MGQTDWANLQVPPTLLAAPPGSRNLVGPVVKGRAEGLHKVSSQRRPLTLPAHKLVLLNQLILASTAI